MFLRWVIFPALPVISLLPLIREPWGDVITSAAGTFCVPFPKEATSTVLWAAISAAALCQAGEAERGMPQLLNMRWGPSENSTAKELLHSFGTPASMIRSPARWASLQ